MTAADELPGVCPDCYENDCCGDCWCCDLPRAALVVIEGPSYGLDKIGVLTRDESQGLATVDGWLRSLGVGATS